MKLWPGIRPNRQRGSFILSFVVTLLFCACLMQDAWYQAHLAFQSRYDSSSTSSLEDISVSKFDFNITDNFNISSLPVGDQKRLFHYVNFTYTLNPNITECTQSYHATLSPPLLFIIIVHSAPEHFEHRKAIRASWAGVRSVPFKVLFFLGQTNATSNTSSQLNSKILSEFEQHNDIVQGNFFDSYKNLTLKFVSALKWLSYHCPFAAEYIVKVDDDVFVNTHQLATFVNATLRSLPDSPFIGCEIVYRPLVKRSHRSKWRVSFKEYREYYYPAYCHGWFVMMTPSVVWHFYKTASTERFFWIDDVFVTGILARKLNVNHTNMAPKLVREPNDLKDRCFDNPLQCNQYVAFAELNPRQMQLLFKYSFSNFHQDVTTLL